MNTGRVLWIIWCLLWAGVWAALCAVTWPHRACVMHQMISADGNFCMTYGTVGSWHALWYAAAAVVAVTAVMVPVGQERMSAPPPDHPVWRHPRV